MPIRVTGKFDVKLAPQDDGTGDAMLGRMTIDKRYHGELDAAGKGQMLSALTGTKNSAGYVAIERVTGSLKGKKGSFVIQHSGTMSRGAQELNINVVPDSGTDELSGLSGKMMIRIVDGQHFYDFDYTFPE